MAAEQEELPTHSASGQQRQEEGCSPAHRVAYCLMCIFMGCTVLVTLGMPVYMAWSTAEDAKQPRYHVALDAVVGLHPPAVLRRPTLDPEFNLTVGLASRSFTRGSCFDDGLAVRVYYGGIQLAGEALPRLCVRPRRSAVRGSVVAVGSGMRMPRMVRGALARDLWRSAAEFVVALTVEKPPMAGTEPGSGWELVSCRVKLREPAASRAPCAVSSGTPSSNQTTRNLDRF